MMRTLASISMITILFLSIGNLYQESTSINSYDIITKIADGDHGG